MLVSFIIPSYNSAQTVGRCLNSIYALPLTCSEFEVVFVDDCSTDNTCEIVATYQFHYKNITLLKQPKNNRQGAARNRGLGVAKGKYICFVDSDDVVADGIVSAIRIANGQKTDMTAFLYGKAYEQGTIISKKEPLSFLKGQIFTGVEMQKSHPYWCSGPVAYVYSKEFLDHIKHPFSEDVLYEDSDFVMYHLYYAKRMTYSPELGYIAYYRDGSTTHSNCHKNLADYLLLGSRMLKIHFNVCHNIEIGERRDESIQEFADGILEGACFNIAKSIRRLYKLKSSSEIVAYYNRIDTHIDRNTLVRDKRLCVFPEYWDVWVRLCLKHKNISVVLNSCLSAIYRMYVIIIKHISSIK